MNRFAMLQAMFDGPSPTMMRTQGMKDARAGKPKSSRNVDYLRGYELMKLTK